MATRIANEWLVGSVAKVSASDRRSEFDAFVASHRERAVGTAWRLLGRHADAAEDVAQEAFVRAYRALPRFRGDARMSTWFFRVLVNEANRYRRRQQLRERLGLAAAQEEDPREWLPEAGETARALPDPLLRQRLLAALDGLARGQREAFVLVHLEGFTTAEVATITGRAQGTIKSHLHRALQALRGALADAAPETRDTGLGPAAEDQTPP